MGEQAWQTVWIDAANSAVLDNVMDGVFDEPIRADRLKRYLANPLYWMVLAVEEGQVIGQCMSVVHHHPDKETELYLDEIGTGDDARRRGVAQSLMHAVFQRADDEGIEEIWLGTEPDNVAARGLYDKSSAVAEPAIIYYLDW
ncbi:MAG: GNAT family N-acetyltransferase [Erythrobacter sp.]